MTDVQKAIGTYAESAYALAVAGAAMIWPPLALVTAAVFLVGLAVLADRRAA